MIDSHCHLTYAPLFDQLDAVLTRARAAGVRGFVTIGTSIADARRAIELSGRHDGVWASAGVHPHEAGKVTADWERELRAMAVRPDVYAIGEAGLDYHYDFAERGAQRTVFETQLSIASEAGKPVVIHCREAHRDVMAVLGGFARPERVVFHCFTGTLAEATEILERGHWLSLTGVVTFKKSHELREVAKRLPAERVMVETDSPYLSPEPVRSAKPNEPAHVMHVARCVAEQRGIGLAEMDALSEANTRRFFGLPAA